MKNISIEKDIIEYCTDINGKLIPQRCTIPVLKKHNWYSYLLQRYDDNVSKTDKLILSESLYRILNKIESAPKCRVCRNAVNYTPTRGYARFCSKKCQNKDKGILEKNSKGVSEALLKTYRERGDEIKSKRQKSLSIYNAGTCSPFSSPDIRDKAKTSVLKRYGVENVMLLPEFHRFTKIVARKKSMLLWKDRGYEIEYLEDNKVKICNGCKIHGDIILSLQDFCNRMKEERRYGSKVCPICHPLYVYSGEEKSLSEFFDSLNLHYVQNDRNVIKPLELDFYFPEYSIAIELNGMLFHSELYKKDKNYHIDKLKRCSEKGIRLLYIWEDEWLYKQNIVKSMLLNIFNKTPEKIYARKCDIRELNSKEYREFTEENHLQGSVNSKYRFGLIYGNRIVAAMGFGSIRISLGAKADNNTCELYRYCCIRNTVIPGAASKLFKYAVKRLRDKGYKRILTYAKLDFSAGDIYKKLGFEYVGDTPPGYFWTNGRKRINRFSVRKSELVRQGEDSSKTEVEIMHSRHFYRCYDTGNMKFMYNL